MMDGVDSPQCRSTHLLIGDAYTYRGSLGR